MLRDPEFSARVRSPEGAEFRAFLERDYKALLEWAHRRIGCYDIDVRDEVVRRTCRRLLHEGVLKSWRDGELSPYRSADDCLEIVLGIAEAEFSAILQADRFRRELILVPRELRDGMPPLPFRRSLSPHERYWLVEHEPCFKRAIAEVRSSGQRWVARLRYIDGHDLSSTARITGGSAIAVLWRLYRASEIIVEKVIGGRWKWSGAVDSDTGRWQLEQRWIWLRNVAAELRCTQYALRETVEGDAADARSKWKR